MSAPQVKYEQHPRGDKGARKSVRKTVQAAAAGRLSPKVAKVAQDYLKAAGLPADKYTQAKELLTAQRRDKFYIPDPVDAERIVLPDCLLANCDGLKMDGGDCDDLSGALAAMLESVGIVCAIVGQAFDSEQHYQHILIACEVEDGVWMYADPSERELQFGQAYNPTRELWLLVPSGRVLCDHAPNCGTFMEGVHPNVHDREQGDAVWVGDGMMGDAPGTDEPPSAPSPSLAWTLAKGAAALGTLMLAVYGGVRLATGER
jgi:hypothetical protein